MHYELYIDVFFLENFTMDVILLAILRKILKCSTVYRYLILGALLGAFLTCLIVILPISYAPVKFILFHGLPGVVMIRTGLGIRDRRKLVRALILLYICGFLTGGVFQFFGQYVQIGSMFLVLAVVSYYVVSGVWSLILYLARQNQYRCQVILLNGQVSLKVWALIDTGNCLRDDITGKPVNIIDKKVIGELYGEEDLEGVRYIPYHTIGKAQGVMPLVVLDGMYVCRKEKEWIEKPLAAVCEEDMTADSYEMILNPDIFGNVD